jgi:transposase
VRPRGKLTRDDTDRLDQVRLACPDITAACDLARVFHDLMQDRRGTELAQWVRLAEREGPAPVGSFAGFLRQDWAAVLAAFTLPYSSGSTEGHVNRLIMWNQICQVAPVRWRFANLLAE